MDGESAALAELDSAAPVFGPDHFEPTTKVQIAIGSGSVYSGLDASGSLPQLDRAFRVMPGPDQSAQVNPDSANVRRSIGTVCQDLEYDGGTTRYNALFVKLKTRTKIGLRLETAPQSSPVCAGASLRLRGDGVRATYIR